MLKLVVGFDDIGYLCTHNILGGIIMNDIERILNYSSDEYGEYLRVKSAIEYHLHAWHDEFDKKILRGKYNPTLWNRVEEYRNFICKKLQVETLTRDTTTMLLSQTRKEISNCIVFEESVQGNHAIGIVEDAMKYHFSLAQKRWKHGEESFIDISRLFHATKQTLLKFSKDYSVGSYLKSKCLEYLILKLRHEFAMQEEEQKRRLREEEKALRELQKEKELAEKLNHVFNHFFGREKKGSLSGAYNGEIDLASILFILMTELKLGNAVFESKGCLPFYNFLKANVWDLKKGYKTLSNRIKKEDGPYRHVFDAIAAGRTFSTQTRREDCGWRNYQTVRQVVLPMVG